MSTTRASEPSWKSWKPPLPVPPKPIAHDSRNQLPSQRHYKPPFAVAEEVHEDDDPEAAFYRDMRMQAEERQRRREERMGQTW